MANNEMIIDEAQKDIGGFLIGRLLPFRKKRSVGPFVFLDHIGPTTSGPNNYIDVDQHPHIGLSTLTYLLEGEMEHKDSTGASKIITPGNIGFMTAGHGVSHTERTPQHLRDGNSRNMHGYQFWVALPKELEQMEPQFDYYNNDTLPQWEMNNIEMTLIAGKAFGKASPLTGYSELFMIDASVKSDTTLDLRNQVKGEVAIVVTEGSVQTDGEEVNVGQMLISKSNELTGLKLKAKTRVLIFGGEPLEEERFLMWNLVASNKELLEESKLRWEQKNFPMVPGDNSYIPFPQTKYYNNTKN